MIKNILLDLDETILDFKKAEKEALSKTLYEAGIEPTTEVIHRYSEINEAQWKSLERGELTLPQVKIKRFEILMREKAIDLDPNMVAINYENHLGENHDFLPGAETFLQNISSKYKVYIASNGTTSVQKRRIKEARIDLYVEAAFLSQEMNAHKPDKEYFDLCFERMPGARREETVIIGDSLTSDMKGGENAGIKTIWYNPKHIKNESSIIPDYEVDNLEQIDDVLESMNRQIVRGQQMDVKNVNEQQNYRLPGDMRRVVIVPCAEYKQELVTKALKNVLEPIGGLDFVEAGMKVGIKVNLVSMMKPEEAATTHPELVKALAQMLIDKGACVTIGDSPGGPFTPVYVKRIYQVTGMTELETIGVKLNDNYEEAEVEYKEAKIAHHFSVTKWLSEQDVIINFCKLKTHGMMGMSAAVKNLFGTIPGTMKPEYHFRFSQPDMFADMLVDLNEYWKPQLHIVDAITGMEGNGPTAGTPRHIGAILASKSPYYLDMACAELIGLKRADVLTMEQAYLRQLGPDTVEEVEIIGQLEELKVHDYQVLGTRHNLQFRGEGMFGKISGYIIEKAMCSRPTVKKEQCIGCKKCHDICPAHAITMVENKPEIDKGKCIHCFCCQEFCPVGAMQVHRPIIAKLIQKV